MNNAVNGTGIHIHLMNACSVANKTAIISEYATDNVDMLAITETWMKHNDPVTANELTPPGFSLHHAPRVGRVGGGVGILYKNEFKLTAKENPITSSYESTLCTFKSDRSKNLTVMIVYRPPSSSFATFLDEFSSYLESLITSPHEVLILGDFNLHYDDTAHHQTNRFKSLLMGFSLKQHVSEATHKCGHILDLVISRENDLVLNSSVKDCLISDHKVVELCIGITRPRAEQTRTTYRKLRALDSERFAADVSTALQCKRDSGHFIDINTYNQVLASTLDKHAPERTRIITLRPHAPWYNDQLRESKQERRRREHRWRMTGLDTDKEAYKEQRDTYNRILNVTKTQYYSKLVAEKSNDPKNLFQLVDTLIHGKQAAPTLPEHTSLDELSNRFADYFTDKIESISLNLSHRQFDSFPLIPPETLQETASTWTEFARVTAEEVAKVIQKSPSKSCSLDPIPTWLLKACLQVLCGTITDIINDSLSSGTVPDSMKDATVSPILKKANIDQNELKHYRPISNLFFVSETLRRIVANQLNLYMTENRLHEQYQSVYRQHHSVETALVRVQNDILMSIDRGDAVLLILLDLSAAFDTVDHHTLITRLQTIGISGNVLKWFQSYLKDRHQSVTISKHSSSRHRLNQGVPQGSVLGPILFSICMIPLARIIERHNLSGHYYADDTQLYIAFRPSLPLADIEAKANACCSEIRMWMTQNMLQLNESKTDVILFGTKNILGALDRPSINIGDAVISNSDSVRNLGCVQDSELKLDMHVNQICRSAYYHLRNISKIRRYLPLDVTEQLVHSFVTSRIDFCNSLLIGIKKCHLQKLQRVQNAAVRCILYLNFRDHTTPYLYALHWLPVEYRIHFKVLLLTFKSLHDLAPSYLTSLFRHNRALESSRQNSTGLLFTPRSRLVSAGDRAFEHAAPALWNSLPLNLRTECNLNVFKRELKTFLFKKAYPYEL